MAILLARFRMIGQSICQLYASPYPKNLTTDKQKGGALNQLNRDKQIYSAYQLCVSSTGTNRQLEIYFKKSDVPAPCQLTVKNLKLTSKNTDETLGNLRQSQNHDRRIYRPEREMLALKQKERTEIGHCA
jgi:hypothetical protein